MQPTLYSRRVTIQVYLFHAHTRVVLKIFEDYVDPIQEAIDDLLLPTLFGQREPLPIDLRRVVTLTPAQGGLGVPN